jgi:hypothetical protein
MLTMDEPRPIGLNTEYAFWLTTEYDWVAEAVAALACVAAVLETEDHRLLVEISDDHDPDEAWHWVRAEIEAQRHTVDLDPMWEEALKWVL